ncbi:MAG: hypothetical protein NZ527_02960, partial [Hydrogenobacter thermophilus]|nr:hypothetical protein [Hydrogenobacter thermophilus]
GYIHPNLLFYAEKVLLAKYGEPPRLENIGFVYPPLAFLPFWVVPNYLLVSPLASALVITAFLSFLLRICSSLVYLIVVYLMLNPLVLFLGVFRFEVLSFYLLLSLSVAFFVLHMEKGYSIYLFLAGLLFGLCFFLDFRALFLIPFFTLAVFLSTRERDIPYRLALLIVKLSPVVFFAFSWLYLNWIFTENPLNFIKSPYSFFRSEPLDTSLLATKGSFLGAIKYTTLRLFEYLPLTLLYFLVLLNLRNYRIFYLAPVYLLYLSPVILVLFSVYFSAFFPAYYYSVLFLLFTLTFTAVLGMKCSKFCALLLPISLASSWVLPIFSKENNERAFVRFLLTGKISGNVEEYRHVAKALRDCRKVLMDDADGFPIVVFTGEPKKFYLPYMYEYYTVLSSPWQFVDCVVVNKKSATDSVSERFPFAKMGFLKGYSIIYDGEKYNVFKR